ncbi:MAG: hypothetical protein IT335_11740 [Thermomicrobiales bacterium]|nr:hypothetical protein [Thermomicrobiales bacterium]
MKDRAMGLLTTAVILALPGMTLAADRSAWVAARLRDDPGWAWVAAIVLVAIAGVTLGFEKRGRWDGLLIDEANRKSLSRLQAIVWGTIVVSGIATGLAINVARGCAEPAEGVTPPEGACTTPPWDLHYPEQFLVLVMLSAAVVILAAVVNGANASRTLNAKANRSAQYAGILAAQPNGQSADLVDDVVAPFRFYGVIAGKDHVDHASWNDIAKGDVGANAAYLDVARVQFLIMTLLVAGAYAVFFLREVTDPTGGVTFPAFDAGLNTLLGISAAAYLGVKSVLGIAASD